MLHVVFELCIGVRNARLFLLGGHGRGEVVIALRCKWCGELYFDAAGADDFLKNV